MRPNVALGEGRGCPLGQDSPGRGQELPGCESMGKGVIGHGRMSWMQTCFLGRRGSNGFPGMGSSFRVQWEQVKHSGRGGAGRSECFEVS